MLRFQLISEATQETSRATIYNGANAQGKMRLVQLHKITRQGKVLQGCHEAAMGQIHSGDTGFHKARDKGMGGHV
ncbi:hypothetical protein SADUNF_Sadunf10G0073500 [Salix dunnii]|uniref:Uncharacterized protein n=1 Tax=Salix dunnii TaxID=1413687 RepID=A0A835JVC9_9ROSI|nr:hypothetical protein SADUNF_Sadunf10G0073500 [Salix dunnii]